jgi:hypothetical protein
MGETSSVIKTARTNGIKTILAYFIANPKATVAIINREIVINFVCSFWRFDFKIFS